MRESQRGVAQQIMLKREAERESERPNKYDTKKKKKNQTNGEGRREKVLVMLSERQNG